MERNQLTCALALTRLKGLSARHALAVYKMVGQECVRLWDRAQEVRKLLPEAPPALIDMLLEGRNAALERAAAEVEWARKHGVKILCYGAADYPVRLLECDDAPLALFFMGNADLNARHSLAVVGTRHCTEYGKDMCRKLIAPLAQDVPDALIVSGLAYGVDIHAHRASLEAGLPTVAVLAHGLDRIYPSVHRDTAHRMLEGGGLLTEYMTGTTPEKGNFVRRNRIVAALGDGCVVVESAYKGGALITARMAQDYHREVMAVPGRATDKYSAGCLQLIHTNAAALVSSAEDVMAVMGWAAADKKVQVVEPHLFPQLTEEEQRLVGLLQDSDGKQINQLVVEANLPVHRISAILFDLEMRGVVKAMPGGCFRLLL